MSFLFFILLTCLNQLISARARMRMSHSPHVGGSREELAGLGSLLPSMWVLRIKLRSAGLLASAFTP